MAAEDQRQLRLGRGEPGVHANADRLARSHADARGSFEEDLRAGLSIDVGVHALAATMLGVAEAGAHLVGAAAGPHFGGVDRQDRLERLGVAAGQRAGQLVQGSRFGFRTADQLAHGVIGDRPRRIAFEDGGRGCVSESNLSQMHEIVL